MRTRECPLVGTMPGSQAADSPDRCAQFVHVHRLPDEGASAEFARLPRRVDTSRHDHNRNPRQRSVAQLHGAEAVPAQDRQEEIEHDQAGRRGAAEVFQRVAAVADDGYVVAVGLEGHPQHVLEFRFILHDEHRAAVWGGGAHAWSICKGHSLGFRQLLDGNRKLKGIDRFGDVHLVAGLERLAAIR